MPYKFSDLIDVARVQRLTDLFYKATSIPASVIDIDGTIVTGSGWQPICTNFHRVNPETNKRCLESDTVLANRIAAGEKYTLYKCKNGLIDAATPISVDGKHIANFFTGQFLFGPPDFTYFREQAKRCGLDEDAYMEAVKKVPVIEEARLKPFLEYFSEFAEMMGEMGLKQLKQIEASARIQESEERWAATLSSIGDAVIATDNAGRVAFMNAVSEELTGWTMADAAGRPVTEVFNIVNEQSRKTVESPVTKVLEHGMIVGLANHTVLLRRDGTETPIDDSGAPIRDRAGNIIGVVLVFRNISDRKDAQQRESHLASFPKLDPNPILEVDAAGKIIFCNPGALVVLEGQGISKDGCEMFLPEDLGTILAEWDKTTESTLTREVRVGDRIFEEKVHLLPHFRVARIYGLDITSRKLREARVTRLTQLHTMLVRVSEAIVRTPDQRQLYQEACRIISDESRFPLVWIGEKRDGCVLPVAWCGTAVDYLDKIDVEVEGALGQGPTGSCIREGRPIINDDFDTNTATAPWREEALRRGFRTSAAFPLRRGREVVAALTIYATQPHDLDAEQLALLETLAEDLSYALDALEEERLRTKAEKDLQRSLKRFELLAHTAEELLQSHDPQKLVNTLCKKVMESLDCHAFFNFLAVEEAGRLRLNAYAGIPAEEAEKIKWLDYGAAVCGCAARDACRIVAEHIPTTPDPRTDLVASYGIKAYACHPLYGPEGKVMGTLSFGTCDKETFTEDDLSLMKAVADQVSVAMIRMKDEEALRAGEERFRTMANAIPQLAWIARRDGYIFWYNQRWYDYTGTTPRDMEGWGWQSVHDPDVLPQVLERWKISIETGAPFDMIFPLKGADGQFRPFLTRVMPVKDPSGEVIQWFGTNTDVTESKRLEEELERRVRERTEAIQRQANLLELAHSAIFVRDVDSKITFWNARAEEVYGWTKAEVLGNISHTLLNGRFPGSGDRYMETLLREGRWEGELTHTTKDGRDITVLSRHALQRGDNSAPIAIMEINLDVTEAKRTEQQLRQAQKLEALGTLAGGIAHDFNNLLAAVIGFGELVRDHLPKESREQRHVQRILEAGMRGRELVKQMLTFSRRTEEEKRPLQLSSIVKESVKLLRASIPSTISIMTRVASESGVILADPVQIQQILMNLATNATYAMREKGGTLDIELSDYSVSPSGPDARGIEPGLYMKLSVRDTGSGIPAEIMDKIFDPFFTTKRLGEGTGLGLSVVLGIVKQSGGHVAVESEAGKGTAFEVYFPKVEEEPATKGPITDEAIPTGSERILFVDDEEALVDMGEELLAELGYDVHCCTSSRQALVLFRLDPSRFDLVVTDQTMPDLTGVQLAAELRALRPDLPIILCTGFSHTANEELAKAAGIKGFVMKPLTKKEIAKTVRKALDEQ